MVGSIATFTGSALNESGKHLFSADFDSSLLEEGSNSVTVRLLDNESGISGGLHTMILNWIHIDLPRGWLQKMIVWHLSNLHQARGAIKPILPALPPIHLSLT